MAVTSGFFNSINGDRKYNARQIGRYLGSLISSGVFPDPSTNLQVMASGGMSVQVSPGKAFIDCHWMENDSMHTLVFDDADMVLDRIDAVVMRLDENDDARMIDIIIKKGTPSSEPRAPEMERGDKVQEYCLAAVMVRKMREDGTQGIAQADITDTRADTDVCGWVTSLIYQVDTHTLFLQWQDAYQKFYADSNAEFDAWMDGLKDKLDGDTVGKILESYKPTVIKTTIPASGWLGTTAPYINVLGVSDVKSEDVVSISLSDSATSDQFAAWSAGQFADGGQAHGQVRIRAYGKRPDVDLPVTMVITEAKEVS